MIKPLLKLYGGALLAGIFGMALMLCAWRLWHDYQDFQEVRAIVFGAVKQQQQQQQHPQTPTRGEKPQ